MMHDPKLMRSSLLAGAHVRFGQPDPNEGSPKVRSSARRYCSPNVSDKPVNAHISVDYTVKGQDKEEEQDGEYSASKSKKTRPETPKEKVANAAVKDLTIAAGDVQKIELSDEMGHFDIGGPVKEAGVEIAFDAAPGALVAQLTSVDQSGDYAFEVPIKDPAALGEWPQGVYPWTVENGSATTLHLTLSN